MSMISPTPPTTSSTITIYTMAGPNQPPIRKCTILAVPPPKNSIRPIENDLNHRREKYDGHRWRIVCTWGQNQCNNVAANDGFCRKHFLQLHNKEPPRKRKTTLVKQYSLPIFDSHKSSSVHIDEDDDIQIIEENHQKPTVRHSINNAIKTELEHFNVFSVDHVDTTRTPTSVKQEINISNRVMNRNDSRDIEYIASKTQTHGLNITESFAKNIPPLTDFEEECLATRLINSLPPSCSMLDAQFYLQKEATQVVYRNYRMKMDTVASTYFYDFLLRQPRVAIHFKQWFHRCKLQPPNTGCPIDMKVWSLGMIVRGATGVDSTIDECEG